MRHRLIVVVLALAAVSAGRPADRAGGRRGGMVTVPRGAYLVGLTEPEMLEAAAECEAATEAQVCLAYAALLAQMPVRTAVVSTFQLDRFEVTRGQYGACAAAGHCASRPLWLPVPPTWGQAHPMTYVTWFDAQAYCQAQGGRLPTETEWEIAARGNGARRWPWGEQADGSRFNHGAVLRGAFAAVLGQKENFNVTSAPDARDGQADLAPVGTFALGAGPFGTYDQAGNAAEWVFDAWVEEGYVGLAAINPQRDVGIGGLRVIRGGSWLQPEYLGQGGLRDPHNGFGIYDAAMARVDVGFRCARSGR
ncbi:MAG: SUMF1/EgtB/PvdO family nonheme iron enzyme [Myxococcales bacterium]|nr:SUMF1/EgtB/PvdO family nonheme iron enzyme [Myxococcales bacterium]